MMTNIIVLGVLVIAVALAVLARRVTAPRMIKIKGFVPEPAVWLPQALDSACSSWKSVSRWTWTVVELDPAVGNQIGTIRVRSGSGDEIVLQYPLTADRDYPADDPYVVQLEMVEFRFRTQWAYRLILGKYPENHVLRMRTRLIRTLPRKARKSSRLPQADVQG